MISETVDGIIDFCIGAEATLGDLLTSSDAMGLLRALIRSGIKGASIADSKGTVRWSAGEPVKNTASCLVRPLTHEGETIGSILLHPTKGQGDCSFDAIADVAAQALNTVIRSASQRLMTTEVHTAVVNRSYEELLEANRKLTLSEARYRDLASSLEVQVEDRTKELHSAWARLLQQEKLASVGRLAAGMAHEINNPLGFVASNLSTLGRYLQSLGEMIRLCDEMESLSGPDRLKLARARQAMKIDFILSDVQDLLAQSREGTSRIARIVSSLKTFSHVDEAPRTEIDLNREIENVLTVMSHEIKKRSPVITRDYGTVLPVSCNAGLICQVILNILTNALEAREQGLEITIRTGHTAGKTVMAIGDNGKGIDPETIHRIFEPFFTTKEVGKGTGMGLAVAHEIVAAHGGWITVESVPDRGSLFTVTLPSEGGCDE